ncbi:hypothetical protein I4U23_028562 [Adineta vaga]|nr:hypothetical protein I4U23_028562 [Adineta vaga]
MDILPGQTDQTEEFLKRMGWPISSTTDEARVKWKIAMKFLIPTKFEVNRAIELYKTHENTRKTENLDRIWISNPNLIREIQSNKFFSLPQLPNQPLTVYFNASQLVITVPTTTISQHDRELVALQALICQLDVATESIDIQQTGLNFIYDMQNCSASQFDMNLSKKILKLLQNGYPAMVKNIFIISAPKWFKIAYKVTMSTPDQMREFLQTQYNYSLEDIPITLGGTYDPAYHGDNRYQICLSTVTNSQSICFSYYSIDCQQNPTKTTSNILFFNTDHHHHHHHSHQNQDAINTIPSLATTKTTSPQTSLVAIVALRRHHESASHVRVRKRESSSSSDGEKRKRGSNESLLEEEEPSSIITSQSSIPQETTFDQSQATSLLNESTFRSITGHQERSEYEAKNSMNDIETRDHALAKRENKRSANSLYKQLTPVEFLSKTQSEIRQEFRKLPNPSAKDTHAAKDERNLDKSRYRDVIPGEATRVKLQPDGDEKHDFINANYVSGHNNQEKAYIFTQGPLQTTVKDFWRMVWQENIVIIVMTTNIRETGMMKCFPYWPMESREIVNTGSYQIQNEKSEKFDSFVITTLSLRKKNHPENRIIYHAHYLKWPDHGIPSNTKDALLFLDKVEYYRQITMTKAPILLHCSAGIGRTGTFCAIDIGIKRYLEKKFIDIPSTVLKMRTERAGSVQTEDQYLFAYLAMMDYIKQQQALQERINESNKASDIQLTDISNEVQIKEIEIDGSTVGTVRTKSNGKKMTDFEQLNNLFMNNADPITYLQEPPTQRGKTLSDSSVSAIQYVTPTTSTFQTVPSRQRSSTEHISSMPVTTDNTHHKKVRK